MRIDRLSHRSSPKQDGLQSIRRALRLVKLVAENQGRGARPSELARQADLNVATTSRILRGLVEERLLEYDQRTRNYLIGPLAYELGLAAKREAGLLDRYRPLLQRIAARTHETAYLISRSGGEAVCFGFSSQTAMFRTIPFETGDRVPLGLGAGGLALLAAQDDEQVERILSENAPLTHVFGEYASPRSLRRAIAEARKNGYARTYNDEVPGLTKKIFRTVGVGLCLPANDAAPVELAVSLGIAVTDEDYDLHEELVRTIREEIENFVQQRATNEKSDPD